MKRWIVLLALVSIVSVIPVHAQDNGERFQWEPYDFSVALPEGWVASASVEELILGLPDDVQAVEAGQTPVGVVVLVSVVEPALPGTDRLHAIRLPERNSPFMAETEIRMFGGTEWGTVDIPPIGDRQGISVARDTYLVTASGPAATWEETLPLINDLIASIEASPAQRSPQDRLTDTFQWRHVRFRIPGNLALGDFGPTGDLLLLTSIENRLFASANLRPQVSYMIIRDFSPTRHFFTLETVLLVPVPFYEPNRPDSFERTDPVFSEIGGFETASITFTGLDGVVAGRAIALRTPDFLYLWVVAADINQWELTERNLFEAMLDTLEYVE